MQPIPPIARQKPIGDEERVSRRRILCKQPMIMHMQEMWENVQGRKSSHFIRSGFEHLQYPRNL
jgi:hypothetical protein